MSRPTPIRRRGFTLIEVMIAVLILALGLLGLGAIIPVVVHEQRRAADSTLGIAASNAAQAYFESRSDFDITKLSSAFDRWLDGGTNGGQNPAWSKVMPGGFSTNATNSYLWEPLEPGSTNPLTPPNELDTSTGNITLWRNDGSNNFTEPATITVGSRLWPSRSLDTGSDRGDAYRPVFVWDFVGRRIPGTALAQPWPSLEPQQIQIAVFVRRIDPGVRVPRDAKLVDVLTGNVPPADARLPVAVDSQGRPTNNGVGEYSPILSVQARAPGATGARNRIRLLNATPIEFSQIAQPGQRILDNLGNVYNVQGPDPTDANYILVTPPVATTISHDARRSHSIRQIIYTPQIPAAVHLFTLSRPAR